MKLQLFLLAILLSTSSGLYASELGRLFTTPQERKALDDIRRGLPTVDAVVPQDIAAEALPTELRQTLPSRVKLSGILQKRNGEFVVWVNGASDLSNKDIPVDRIHILKESPNVLLQADQRSATLKPGQVWRLDENVILEGYLSDRDITPNQ